MKQAILVTITFADADHWPEMAVRARELDAHAAVLQGDGPGLTQLLDDLAAQGCHEILLAGVTFGETGVPASWVGRVARWWLSQQSAPLPKLWFYPQAIRGLPNRLPELSQAKLLQPDADTLNNPGWQEPPPVTTHLLVCSGPRCSAKGAAETLAVLGEELNRRGMLDEQVLLTQTSCLYPCNRAPVVAIQPEMTWLGPITAADVPTVIDQLDSRAGNK